MMKDLSVILAIWAVILVIIAAISFIAIASHPSGTSVNLSKESKPEWQEAMSWMNANLPADAGVLSWTDYAKQISTEGNRTAIGNTSNKSVVSLIADLFMANSTRALQIAKALNGGYMVVFATGRDLGNGYDIIGSYYGLDGDEGNIAKMVSAADSVDPSINLSSFLDPLTDMPSYQFWNSTLIGELLPFAFDGYGEYNSTTGILNTINTEYDISAPAGTLQLPLYTYNITYPAGSHPFELVFNSTGTRDPEGYFSQVLIYRINP